MLGTRVQPIYQEPVGTTTNPPDVDQPPLAAFSSVESRPGGTLRYNTDVPLANCPSPVAASASQDELTNLAEQLGLLGDELK